MRQEDSRRPVWEFADRVQITHSVLEAQWKPLVVSAPSRRLLRHTLLPLYQRFVEIDLIPSQADQLTHTQAVPKADHDHCSIPMTISTAFIGSFCERLDLDLGQMLARPAILVLGLARRNSSEKPAWRRVRNQPKIG